MNNKNKDDVDDLWWWWWWSLMIMMVISDDDPYLVLLRPQRLSILQPSPQPWENPAWLAHVNNFVDLHVLGQPLVLLLVHLHVNHLLNIERIQTDLLMWRKKFMIPENHVKKLIWWKITWCKSDIIWFGECSLNQNIWKELSSTICFPFGPRPNNHPKVMSWTLKGCSQLLTNKIS